MKKNILNILAITVIATTSFIACDNKQNNKTEEAATPTGGLNAQPQEEVTPATPVNDSVSNKTNPKVGGMNAQPQQEIAPASPEEAKK